MFTSIHKHYSVEEWKQFAVDHADALQVSAMFNHLLTECLFGSQNIAVSSGSSNDDLVKLKSILAAIPALSYICLDVANGYSEHFVSFVRTVRKEFPEHTIMVILCQFSIFFL